jgi:pyruvate kinase
VNLPTKKTKIVCTIGPASWEQPVLEQMIQAGMNIARINLAHGGFDSHRESIANVRAAAHALDKRVAIFADLPGPKMRIDQLAEDQIVLKRGQQFILQTKETVGDLERASMEFEGLPQAVKPGDQIYLNDGNIQFKVDRVTGPEVHCTVQAGGELRSYQGVNFPGIDLGISAFTAHDQELLAFAADQELDGIGASFVLGAEDILTVRKTAADLKYHPFIIAKVERAAALKNTEEILEVADGIMVARGDLGVEIPIEKIPITQKELIRQANMAGKPVITATQMLESMTHHRRPTRSEATDVVNAILDGTDCVMLSGETAIGQYPVETVSTMANLAREAEAKVEIVAIAELLKLQQKRGEIKPTDLLSLAVFEVVETLQPTLIFILAKSGATARHVSRFGLNQWIVAPSSLEATCQHLQFSRGIFPTLVAEQETLSTPESRRKYAIEKINQYGIDCGLVLLIEGSGTLKAEDTKRIDIIDLG